MTKKFIASRIEEAAMTLEMSDVTCRLTPWNEKIIHVLLSPVSAPCDAPLFGIDGTPDTEISFTCDEDASHVSMALKDLTANADNMVADSFL